jgi:L-ribulose-5-phosphate 3-epimerase
MKLPRRDFLKTAALTGAALACTANVAESVPAVNSSVKRKRVKLAIATYSYWHFRDPKVSIEQVIEKVAALGVEGVDILHRQMELPEKDPLIAGHRAYLRRLKRLAFTNGVAPVCLSTHQGFVSPKPEIVAANAEHTKKCIEICYELGIPALRINTGRWGTVKNFDDLMAQHGVEEILPGYTEDEGFNWCIGGIEACLSKAKECGVMLALENHWGLARTADGLLRIANAIQSPWLGVLMDTGNFLTAPYKTADYEQLAAIAPKTVFVQAKTYPGGGEWYTLDMDYKRIAKILAGVNYRGYVSLEMEGRENPDTAVTRSIEMLRKAFE